MYKALIITPVKDSIETTISTIKSVKNSTGNYLYYIYNDFSTENNSKLLEKVCNQYHLKLINLKTLTQNPSPNYRLILQHAQKKALEFNLPVIIIESDIEVNNTTIKELINSSEELENIGLIGCITKDRNGEVNYPYKKFKNEKNSIINTNRSLSFCCTLLSTNFLKAYNFKQLNTNKHWYDISISRKSKNLGFNNYLLTTNSVIHTPHSSRPWKLIKYKNPIKYYILKIIKGFDKI